MRIWMDSEVMAKRPEIEIIFVGVDECNSSQYAASCPLAECEWSDVSGDILGLKVDVDCHEQWHEDGMPD